MQIRKQVILFWVFATALFLSLNNVFAQINSDGIPFIKNYSARKYSAAEPNWAVTQDHRGILYFGNDRSILEYDGQNWIKISIPDQKYILSLATGQNGVIYAGGVDDFGRLAVNNIGQLEYLSFKNLIPDSIEVKRVWKTYTHKNLVYFCTLQYIFVYDYENEKILNIELPEDNFWSFLIDEKLYTGNYNSGLMVFQEGELQKANGGEYFINKDIFSILKWSKDTLLIAISEKGLCFYDVKSGNVSSFGTSSIAARTNNILIEGPVYCGVKINDDQFAFGTLGNGLYVINKKGEIILHLTEKNGLQNQTVSALYFSPDNSGMLWLTLANGISSVNINSTVRYFSGESGLFGALFEIADFNGEYYVSTMQGVFKLSLEKFKNARFENVPGISGEAVYSILSYIPESGSKKLIAASDRDLYVLKNNRFVPLNTNVETHRLLLSKIVKDRIYVATSRGIYIVENKHNNLVFNKNALGLSDETVTKLTEDKNGNLWCNTISGIKLISNKGNALAMPESINGKNGVFFDFKDDVYFAFDNQILKYNYIENDFYFDDDLNALIGGKRSLKDFFALNDSLALAFYSVNNLNKADYLSYADGSWKVDSLSLRIIPPMTIYNAILDSKRLLVGGQDGLFIHSLERQKNFNQKYKTFIRQIIIGTDSLVYKGADGFFEYSKDDETPVPVFHNPINYKFNNISFAFSAGFFENEEDLQYRSYLEGFDPDWSTWQNDVTRTYTNLKEGTYRFFVKAKNVYGVESEAAVIEFRILPPWYRTWWAYVIYGVIAFLIIRISISLYTRKLQEDKRRLEDIVKERTAEIVEKNKRIEHQNKAITDSIRYAKRIQTAVLPNKQTSDLFEYFIYFAPKDIVSGDFYWVNHFEKQNRIIAVAADCTGHGVPGAFMSMLGTSFLNEIVGKLDVNHSDSILNLLRDYVIKTLSQGVKEGEKDERKDGMDVALVSIDLKTMKLEFSGANNPLILIRDNELIEYKPDKMPIGAYVRQDVPFVRTEVVLQKNDIFYIFSDGYMDQFGGSNGQSKYMKKRFKEFLFSIHHKPICEQKSILAEEMQNWMNGEEQIDDQLVIGMKVL
ncbi:MAG: SpoIIE family protein phosphatase [Bacteroidetes bacterium]|nr:SpoIIE family protein phosphatase [Bacteroidota bacterium]